MYSTTYTIIHVTTYSHSCTIHTIPHPRSHPFTHTVILTQFTFIHLSSTSSTSPPTVIHNIHMLTHPLFHSPILPFIHHPQSSTHPPQSSTCYPHHYPYSIHTRCSLIFLTAIHNPYTITSSPHPPTSPPLDTPHLPEYHLYRPHTQTSPPAAPPPPPPPPFHCLSCISRSLLNNTQTPRLRNARYSFALGFI